MKFTNKIKSKSILTLLIICLICSLTFTKKTGRQGDEVEMPQVDGFVKTQVAPEVVPIIPPLEKVSEKKEEPKEEIKLPEAPKIEPGMIIPSGPNIAVGKTLYEVNNLLNRGYSLLADQSGILERPASTLSNYNVFAYEFDIEKALNQHTTSTDVIFDGVSKNDKGQRILKEYSAEEIIEAQEFAIKGNYKLPNSNYLLQRGISVRKMGKKKSVLYYHEKVEFSLELNKKTDFPKLSHAFLADCLMLFNRPYVNDFGKEQDYVSDGLAFLQKYGTHYLIKTKWGSRLTLLTELKLNKEDMATGSKTAKSDTNVKSGTIALEGSKDKPGERFFDFDQSMELGNCKVDTLKNDFSDCKKEENSYGLIGFEVDYLYNLFNPAVITSPLKLPDNSIVTPDRIENVQKNMKHLIDSVEAALNAKNSVISDLVIYNNMIIEDKGSLVCIGESKNKRFGPIKNSLFGNEHKIEKLHPIFKLNKKDHINVFDYSLIAKKKYSTYACLVKRFNIKREDFFSSQLFNREYINGLVFSSDATIKADNLKPENCTNFWAGKGGDLSDPKKYTVNYLCMKKTNNFLDSKIITDIKIKSFDGNNCAPFKYNDRDYSCLCEKDLGAFMNKKMKTKRFLCYATKAGTMSH